MRSKTRIVVLHMKEVIYTTIFIILGIVLIFLLVYMFGPSRHNKTDTRQPRYKAGVYTSSIQFEGQNLDVQVVVDENHINSVSFVNLNDTVTTMYPLMQSSMDNISEQICKTQCVDNISYSEENQYTASMLLNAVEDALQKAAVDTGEYPVSHNQRPNVYIICLPSQSHIFLQTQKPHRQSIMLPMGVLSLL